MKCDQTIFPTGEESSSVSKPACILWAMYGCLAAEEQALSCLQGQHDINKENNWYVSKEKECCIEVIFNSSLLVTMSVPELF